MRLITISRILGRQGLIKNYNLSKIKNYLREDDEFTGSCVTTNDDRYYNLDERSNSVLIHRRRYSISKI
jgi:hypothetical protein